MLPNARPTSRGLDLCNQQRTQECPSGRVADPESKILAKDDKQSRFQHAHLATCQKVSMTFHIYLTLEGTGFT